jgi:hypothetical protein
MSEEESWEYLIMNRASQVPEIGHAKFEPAKTQPVWTG